MSSEKVPLQLLMELFDLQCSEDLKSKLLIYHILKFYKSHIILFERFPKFILYTQQVVTMFGTRYHWRVVVENEAWWRNCQIVSCLMCSFCQPLQRSNVPLINYDSYHVNLAGFVWVFFFVFVFLFFAFF